MFGMKYCEKILTKWNNQSRASKVRCSLGLLVVVFVSVLVFAAIRGDTGFFGPNGSKEVNKQVAAEAYLESLTTKYENCTISLNAAKQESKPKLFWTPGHPDSINEGMFRSIVRDLTGNQAPAVSYYAAKGVQRQCKSPYKVISLCLVGSDINPETANAAIADTFNGEIIMQLRNPRTWMPAHHNGKAIRYHDQQGQVSEDSWREFRDEFFDGILRNWVHFVRMFDNMPSFKVVMYLPMEYLMDSTKGPHTLNQLALVLQKGGFETIIYSNMVPSDRKKEDERWACFWYQHVDRQTLELYTKYGYEYPGFIPGFTTQQRDLMLQELKTLLSNTQNPPELAAILQMYYNDIHDNTRIDDPVP